LGIDRLTEICQYRLAMTPKQFRLLKFIRDSVVHLKKSPTYREMRDFMSVRSNQAIDDLLSGLEKRGYIKRGGTKRGIVLTPKGFGYEGVLSSSEEPLQLFIPPASENTKPFFDQGQKILSQVSIGNISLNTSFFLTRGGEIDESSTS